MKLAGSNNLECDVVPEVHGIVVEIDGSSTVELAKPCDAVKFPGTWDADGSGDERNGNFTDAEEDLDSLF